MKALLGALTLCAMLAGTAPLEAAVLYATDDGAGELPVGGGPPIPADFWWGQSFEAVAGGETITNLQVAFGSSLGGQRVGVDGLPVQVFLYEDTDDNGDPNDGLVRLQTVNGTTASANTDTFIDFPIPPTAVSGTFFVAALMSDTGFDGSLAPAGLPAGFDQTSSAGTSWVADSTAAIDPDNVSGTANLSGAIVSLDALSFPGNLMIRAEGIPEPTAGILLLIGGAMLGVSRRRK